MSFYEEIQAVAQETLDEFGQTVQLTRNLPGDTLAGSTAKAIRVDKVKHADSESRVEIGDWRILVDGTVAPAEGDTYIDDIEIMYVVRVEPIRPAGLTIANWVWARMQGPLEDSDIYPVIPPTALVRQYEESGDFIYQGSAAEGSGESEAVWTITRFGYSDGTLISNDTITAVSWSGRASHDYS